MGVRIGCGLSDDANPRTGARQAALIADAAGDGRPADVALVFAAGRHLGAPETTLEAVHDVLAPSGLVGCGAGGVLGQGREVERGTAVVVWAAWLDEGEALPWRASVAPREGVVAVDGVADLTGASGALLLADATSFPTDAVLDAFAERSPGVPVLGGLASAAGADGGLLFFGEEAVGGGAVGVRFEGVELLPCVSQGAAPLGPELEVTGLEGNVISELDGRPALARLRRVVDVLDGAQRRRVSDGLLLGLRVGAGPAAGGDADGRPGDFLVRGLVAADPAAGTIAVGAPMHEGQVVRLHARDAASADRELREALDLRRVALGGAAPAGALVFSCNGRGRGLFGVAHHDAGAVAEAFGRDVPAAGFFAAGEIGPVGGGNFLHGFTATVAVFG